MCTSLRYVDVLNKAYVGRTLELSLELPYQVAYFPQGQTLTSTAAGFAPLSWAVQHAMIAVVMPAQIPAEGQTLQANDFKVIEGVNTAGLSFSVQSYPQVGDNHGSLHADQTTLSAVDIGAYVLGQYRSVEEVKAGLATLQIALDQVPMLGGLRMPFHYSVHDASGASLVIEFHQGVLTIQDNPVGVLTNAPQFSWHLTNLNNYTFLSNVDHSKGELLGHPLVQPGSGTAKIGLPVTDSSVDRFIRATYYANFAEKASTADEAVQMVAHIMNNFDRPRGITIDPPETGSSHLEVAGIDLQHVPTEFTSWTSITDLDRGRLYLRNSGGMNYFCLDLKQLSHSTAFIVRPMQQLAPETPVLSLA